MPRKFKASADHVGRASRLGYTVNVAQEGYTDPKTDEIYPDVYRVEGHGVSIMLRDDDKDTWDHFLVPEAHEHRANFARHMNADDEFEMTEDEIMKSSFQAAVGVGSMTQDEADEAFASWTENVKAARDAEN